MMSPDPVGFDALRLVDPQRWNKYVYAVNNPLTYGDPDGRDVIVVNFPDGAKGAGHIGIVAVNPYTGDALYGGFNPIGGSPIGVGIATPYAGTIRFDPSGTPERLSVDAFLGSVANREQQGNHVRWAYFKASDARTAMLREFILRESRNFHWYYVWGSTAEAGRNCLGFCVDAFRIAGLEAPKPEGIKSMFPNYYFRHFLVPIAVMTSEKLKPRVTTCYGSADGTVCDP
jgi:hypothetical protein